MGSEMSPALWSKDGNETKELRILTLQPTPCIEFANSPRFANSTRLTYLAYISTSYVPLHQIVGPSLQCTTDDPATESWLATYFLAISDHADASGTLWWESPNRESDVGIVFHTEGAISAWEHGPSISEVVLYAACVPVSQQLRPESATLPGTNIQPIFHIRALPLSSHLNLHGNILSGTIDGEVPGVPITRDCASDHDAEVHGAKLEQPERPLAGRVNVLELAHSLSPFPHDSPGLQNLSGQNRVQAFSRSTGVKSPATESSELSGPASINKATLQRVVLTGMRMYGLQQRKRQRGAPASTPPRSSSMPVANQAASTEDGEFKMIYHQTYKGAAFALRKDFVRDLVDQEDMRDVVDKLLALFCRTGPTSL